MMLRKTRKKIPGKYTGGDLKKKKVQRKKGRKQESLFILYVPS